MSHLSLPKLVAKRVAKDWKIMVTMFVGITVATSVAAAAPLYPNALDQLDFQAAVDRLATPRLNLAVFGPDRPISEVSLQEMERLVTEAIDLHLSPIYVGQESASRSATAVIGVPELPLPQGGGVGVLLSKAFVQHLDNLEDHSVLLEGRVATNEITIGPWGQEIEGVVASQTARRFGLALEDSVSLSPSLGSIDTASVRIVGIFEPDNPTGEFWTAAGPLVDPPVLETSNPLLVQLDPDEPPIPLFVSEEAMVEVLGQPLYVLSIAGETYLSTGDYLAGVPSRPLPEGAGTGIVAVLGHFQTLSDFDQNIRIIEGEMPDSRVVELAGGVRVEGALPAKAADTFRLGVGDSIDFAPSLGLAKSITAEIVGIFEPDDPTSDYWTTMGDYLEPAPLAFQVEAEQESGPEVITDITGSFIPAVGVPLGVQANPNTPAFPLFTTDSAMATALERVFPGTQGRSTWHVSVSTERLKDLPISEARDRLLDFEQAVLEAVPGSSVSIGPVRGLTDEGKRSNFFSKIPVVLLLALLVATALVFLAMMVSHLVEARDSDAALLRNRGIRFTDLLQLYTLEGLLLVVVATAAGPFIALAGVSLVGVLPFFQSLTDGSPLQVGVSTSSIAASTGVGLLCLVIFVVSGVLRAKQGLLDYGRRVSRPPTASFFQRYYLDVALLAIGGLIFWELHSRGQFVSGGLLKDVEVDETLLVAPVLLLIGVALLFSRLFPLVVRFLGGESPAMVHVYTFASLAATGGALVVDLEDIGRGVKVGLPVLLVALGGVYWVTRKAGPWSRRLAGLLVQAVLVAGILALQPPERGQALFVPSLALIFIVPGQVAFALLKATTSVTPVWLSVGLWHMARNPLRYNGLVLLIVPVTGVVILAATVGETLETSRRDQVQFRVASDIKIRDVDHVPGGAAAVKQQLLSASGISSSAAYRTRGDIGGQRIDVLAIEAKEFDAVSWYRDDFSELPLSGVMRHLYADSQDRIEVPPGAASIGIWVRPELLNPLMSIAMIFVDSRGSKSLVPLGTLSGGEWQLLSAEIPAEPVPPVYLASVLTFEPPELPASAGSVFVDNIHVTLDSGGTAIVLEDFELERSWTPLAVSRLTSENEFAMVGDAYAGAGAGVLRFRGATLRGFRGFYKSPTGGPLPVVVSRSLLETVGLNPGDEALVQIETEVLPMRIVDTVDHFPTMNSDRPFVLADLEGLQAHVDALPVFLPVPANELYVESGPIEQGPLLEDLKATVRSARQIEDAASQLAELERDPFATAAWRPMVFLTFGIGLIAATVGFIAYLWLFVKRSGAELGSMESIGLSRVQMMALLGFEHLSIAAIGVGLGSWVGFQMSRLMVSPLAVTEEGEPVLPPFLLTTDWNLLLPAFGLMVGVFVVGLLVLSGGLRRLDLWAIGRSGEF